MIKLTRRNGLALAFATGIPVILPHVPVHAQQQRSDQNQSLSLAYVREFSRVMPPPELRR